MPNWCSNSMTVTGPEQQVRAIAAKVTDESNFTVFMPQPVDEAGELIDGTSWQYDNWGTKWGDSDTQINHEDYSNPEASSLGLSYLTAWGPMTKLVCEISRIHPQCSIDIEYEESGMSFFGIERITAGEIVSESHHEYNFSDGAITLPTGFTCAFDTDWDDPEGDPSGSLNDAVFAAMEHLWVNLTLEHAPSNEGSIK